MNKSAKPTSYISYLDHNLRPFCDIDLGEECTFQTMNAFGGKIETKENFKEILNGNGRIFDHPATGPVYVNGIKKGEAIAVSIKHIRLTGDFFQCVSFSTGVIPAFKNERNCKIYKNNTSISIGRAKVQVMANLGYIATAWRNRTSCARAGAWGGNMDFVQINEGCSVHLPVFHNGALLAVGDVHAVQGEGEISGTGAEADAFVTVKVNKSQYNVSYPVIETQKELLMVGYGGSLKASVRRSVVNALDFLNKQTKLQPTDAYLLLGLAGNITLGNSTGMIKTAAVKFDKKICST